GGPLVAGRAPHALVRAPSPPALTPPRARQPQTEQRRQRHRGQLHQQRHDQRVPADEETRERLRRLQALELAEA
ncbi:hypothetical protein, partial [Streptomyces sp. NPDC059802]|uniref:hypothetical protein n=1 Tax=Streptomyces sp. NPDC059802 TaxID=3346952 RepID=UPI00364B9F45